MSNETTRPARTVAVMMAITIIGKLMGVLRDRMQAVNFGADTAEGIAFTQASLLPRTFLDVMFAAAFSASFIPVFTSYMETKGKRAAFDLASTFISITTVLTFAVVVVSMFFAEPIFVLSLRGDEFPYGTIALGARLLRFMFPLMIFSGLAFSFTGMLQSLGEFRLPAAMSVVSNGAILVYYFFFIDRFGVQGLAVAFLVGWALQGIIQLPVLVRHKFRFRFRLDLGDPGIRQIGRLAVPVLVSSWVLPVNILVNVSASSQLYGGEFGVVAITLANSLFAIVSGVFILSVSNLIFPKLSRHIAVKDDTGFSSTLNETVRVLLFLLLPLTLGLMSLATPLVRLVHGGGLFCERAIEITGTALLYFAPGVVGYGLLLVLSRACYARMDGRTPILAGAVAIVANGVLSFTLAPVLDIAGPALAGTISQTLGAAVLIVSLSRQRILLWGRDTVVDITKMVACAVVMLVAVLLFLRQMNGVAVVLQVGVSAMVGGVVYFVLAWLFRIREMMWVKNMLRRNGNRG